VAAFSAVNFSKQSNMKQTEIRTYSIIVLILSWLLWSLCLFSEVDLKFEILGFSLDLIAMVPGIVALVFLFNRKEKLLPYFKNFGKVKDWLIAFAYPLVAALVIIAIGLIAKFIHLSDEKNVETLILGIVLDYPQMLVWSIPTLILLEMGWRVFFFGKIGESSSILKGMLFSSIIWMLTFMPVIVNIKTKSIINFENIPYLISVFIFGMLSCWLYLRSKSIWVIIFLNFNWLLWNNFLFGDPILQTQGIFIAKYWLLNLQGIGGIVLNLFFIPLYLSDAKKYKNIVFSPK
jgi:membrane protease YdiL (CAAX protease family)